MDTPMKTAKIIYGILLFSFLAVIPTTHGSITRIDGTGYANSLELNNVQLQLKGTALLKYLIFIEAYTGAFYLPINSDNSQAFDDIPRYLVLEYRVSISAEDFARATRQKIKESITPDVFSRILPQIEALNRLYRDVGPKDRYALAYIPGEGTRLIYNSTELGTIQGSEFANALFGIWLGHNPIDEDFRDRLLGKKQ